MYLLTPGYENAIFLDEKIVVWETTILPGATYRRTRQLPRNGAIKEIKFNIGEDEEGRIYVTSLAGPVYRLAAE